MSDGSGESRWLTTAAHYRRTWERQKPSTPTGRRQIVEAVREDMAAHAGMDAAFRAAGDEARAGEVAAEMAAALRLVAEVEAVPESAIRHAADS